MSRGPQGRRISTNPQTTQGGLDTRVTTDAVPTGMATERASDAARRGARLGDGVADRNQMTSIDTRARPSCDIAVR
jgi:hypothetical protein